MNTTLTNISYVEFRELARKNVAEATGGDIKLLSESEIFRIWIFLSAFPRALTAIVKKMQRPKRKLK